MTTLWWRRFGGEASTDPAAAADEERAAAQRAVGAVAGHWQRGDLRKGVAAVHAIGRTINQRLAATEPWNDPDPVRSRSNLDALLPWVDALALAAWPLVPTTSEAIRTTLGRSPRPGSWVLPSTAVRIASAPTPPVRRPADGRT